MFRPLARSHRRPHRRGTSFVLIVVVMISFAAAVGVAFALFAGQTLRINTAQKEGQGGGGLQQPRAPEPNDIINQFFSALIFDTGDDGAQDVTNALRGQSFAASMYGRNPGTAGWPGTTTPWNGIGTFRELVTVPNDNPGNPSNRAELVNFTQMRIGGQAYLFDPEQMGGSRTNGIATSFASVSNRTRVAKNAGYSSPDIKDFFLSQVDPATGQVLVPSFHREWLFGKLDPLNGGASTNTTPAGPNNWFNNPGMLRTLRPRPAEHPRFPRVGPNADLTYTGDVQNWPGGFTYAVDPTTANTPNQVFRYYGRNDSLWMYTGAPLVQFGNRKVVPMVAPLIVPLDGLFNASAHGNTAIGGAHFSSGGYGPWEVNMNYLPWPGTATPAPPIDVANIVGARGSPIQRNAINTNQVAYDPNRNGLLPDYAPVAWASVAVGQPSYPVGNSLAGLPNFPSYQSDNNPQVAHPSLFNPTQWPTIGGAGRRAYPASDLRRLELRYAFNPDFVSAAELGKVAPATLLSTPPALGAPAGTPPPFPYVYAIGQNTLNSYRLDTVHANRALVTPRGFALDRPKLTPTYNTALEMVTLPDGRYKPGFVNGGQGAPQVYPSPGGVGAITDFAGATNWYNTFAALGSVNLNRPLADYRLNTNLPLQAGNGGNPVADQDRRELAYDIFVRLIATQGGAALLQSGAATLATANGRTVYTIQAAPGSAQFNALRYLAQLAANIVDYIDADDVSTVFVWNPMSRGPGVPSLPSDPLNPADFAVTEIGNRVVFGVEKPRLVINEAYSEIANDTQDGTSDPNPANKNNRPLKPGANAHVRFWVELLNPSGVITPGTGNIRNPLDDGGVVLSTGAYRLDITRAQRLNGKTVEPVALNAAGSLVLNDPANVTGSLTLNATTNQLYAPDISYFFTPGQGGQPVPDVETNKGNPNPNGDPLNGVLLVGPVIPPFVPGQGQGQPPRNKAEEFNPWPNQNAAPPAPWTKAVFTTQVQASPNAPGMLYTIPMTDTPADLSAQQFKRHVVMLRRLANPYVAFNPADPTNPYITTDAMDYVPSFDTVYRVVGQSDPRNARTAASNPPSADFDPPGERFSVGKVQPYAGYSLSSQWVDGAGVYNQYTFPNSMVLAQQPPGNQPPAAQRNTFGRHNYAGGGQPTSATVTTNAMGQMSLKDQNTNQAETLMLPFDWLVHMDRPLVNQIELFSARDCAPHRVTQDFVRNVPGANNTLSYEFGLGRWASDAGLSRALEMLTVKPFTFDVAHGGRMPGPININALQDKRVLQGLFDRPNTPVEQSFVNDVVWSRWLESRNRDTTAPVPADQPGVTVRQLAASGNTVGTANAARKTVFEGATVAGQHQPFLSFGGPVALGGGTSAYTAGGNLDNTILRRDGTTAPLLYAPSQATAATYMQQEPVRKVFNNVTTVNHNYLVFLTIGYFEIDLETTNPVTGSKDGLVNLDGQTSGGLTMPRIGQEAYLSVPGDLRQKVIAVVDMTGMFLESGNSTQAEKPYFTALAGTAYPLPNNGAFDGSVPVQLDVLTSGGNVMFDGAFQPLGGTLILGYGVEQQIVTVANGVPLAQTPRPGATGVMVTGLRRPVWGGSSVSNVRPGYSGPQGAFDYNDPKYKSVIPYLLRVK